AGCVGSKCWQDRKFPCTYMVAVPAVLEAGAETKFCASLLQPNETLVMTVSLTSEERRRRRRGSTLLKQRASVEFHICAQFKVPLVKKQEVQTFEVEVRGDTFYSKEVRKVMIQVYQPMTFVQTDKPLYLPGQTVHFRVVTLDTKFRPANQLDANNNRIGQWLNETSNSKILQLSYTLSSEAREGTYQIRVAAGETQVTHQFKVKKYVLPKFEVKIDTVEEVNIDQEEFQTEACAKYTYGQSVPGNVQVEICRRLKHNVHNQHSSSNTDAPCHHEIKQFTVNINIYYLLTITWRLSHVGISQAQQKKIRISYVVGKLSFIDTPSVYEQGSNVEGKVIFHNNTPIADMPVHLFEGEVYSARLLQNLTTDSDGVAAFSISTGDRTGNIHLHISNKPRLGYPGYRVPYYETQDHTVSAVQQFSPDVKTVSSLQVKNKDKPLSCDKEEEIFIQYTIVGEAQGSVDVMYLKVPHSWFVVSVTESEVSFKLKVSPEMAPFVQVVAYAVLPSKTMIAKSADFSTEKCFSNKVSLEFSPSSAVPGEETTMQVRADPDSLCGVSAVDRSVLIEEPGKGLDADKIFNLLPVRKVSSIPYELNDPTGCFIIRTRRNALPYAEHVVKNDARSVGLKMATNLFFRMPPCLILTPQRKRVYASEPPPIVTVRTFFPETWIWDLVEVGESGTKDVSLTVPDTITTWETEAFCLSPQGFGLAPRKEITVFQPFFLELTLPYSIIRGEHFELKATTFSYLTSCIMVTVTPAPSLDYTLTPLSGDQYTSCLCGSERKTLSWTMTPSTLGTVNVSVTAEAVASQASCDNEIVSVPERGRIDVVTKSLIVKFLSVSVFCLYTGKALTEEIDIRLSKNVIPGSARASISVMGDILGRALKNLDGLLKMPYGCGEQNMALLAPNIYILEYLTNTQQLTPAIKEKATTFLTSGYQRQLNYKHAGAYSTFGSGPGNAWLTAFVLRSFTKAQSFIYIDPQKIEESKTWLLQQQRQTGCFLQSGKLFNNRMKGGVSDEVTLSAYITAVFLEMKMPVNNSVMTNSLSCLKESISNLNNTYTTALLAYVFTVAGDMETRAHLLQHLDTVAIRQGFLYWSQTSTETSASLSVEISSYVLLAKLSASPSNEDLGYASHIVRWLTSQQNHYGGFSSTQDTVVALQALALYATLVFSAEGSSTVTVQSPSGHLTFYLSKTNKLVYQEKMLQDLTGKYSLEVKGTACVSMQISLHYNIPTPTDATTLSVEVTPEVDCTKSHRPKLTLKLQSLYSGKETSTNMVILDIKMLSGFVPDPESLKRLKGALLVARVEQNEDHVLVYITELKKNISVNHQLELIQELPVENLKPAVVKIYDYYQPSDQAETEYSFRCAAGNSPQ
uniref:Alpha-2-macroglobulin-like n=1 Tax=Mastacembelus armatus TaxID=205130 RepID=A0A7N8XN56_9TELE